MVTRKEKQEKKQKTQGELNEKKRNEKMIFKKNEDQNKAKRKTKTSGDTQEYSKEERRNKEEKKGRNSKGSAKNCLFQQKTNTKTE